MASSSTVSMLKLGHLRRVRLLYKTILRIHRGLPDELQIVGDNYVKDEFRRHKTANTDQTIAFMEEWAKYAVTVSKQIGLRGPRGTDGIIGQPFGEQDLNHFSDEQLAQLLQLYKEASKPREDDESSCH